MAGYLERVAKEKRRQRILHGEEPIDVAYAIGVNVRTYERWEAATSNPRTSNLRALGEHWGIEIKDLRPDLEAEESRLERLEEKLDEILQLLQGDAEADETEQLVGEAEAEVDGPDAPRRQTPDAASG